jgi:spore germination protein YaaH
MAAGRAATSPPRVEGLSIHAEELAAHRLEPPGRHDAVALPAEPRALTHTIYGWYPYWMGDAYLGFRWELLTHLSFFCLETNDRGEIVNDHGWPESWQGLIQSAKAAGVQLTITCTLFDSAAINRLIRDDAARATLIQNLIDACLSGGAEGVNIDFEGSNLDKARLVLFMQELSTALRAAIPGAHLSMATPSVDWTRCWDYDELGAVCDALCIMCYGYHWSGSGPGPISPLTAGDVWSPYCVEWTVDDYLHPDYGTTPEKLVLGFPYYGRDWVVSGDPSAYPADDGPGSGQSRTYARIRSDYGGYTPRWDPHSQTPWLYYWSGSEPHQLWYDDAESLGRKYDLVIARGLGGIAIWALGYDGEYPELWELLEDRFAARPTPTPTSSPTPTTAPPPSPTPPPTPTPLPSPTGAPPEIRLTLLLDAETFRPGDLLDLDLLIEPLRPGIGGDLYVALEVEGNFYFHPAWGATPAASPFFFSVALPYRFDVLALTLPAALQPGGPYSFYALFTAPGASTPLSNLARKTFRFAAP